MQPLRQVQEKAKVWKGLEELLVLHESLGSLGGDVIVFFVLFRVLFEDVVTSDDVFSGAFNLVGPISRLP